jgi:ABC-2 type transport system permease protein
MTALVRGELIKTMTTRTVLGYAAGAVGLAVLTVLIGILEPDGVMTAADKQQALSGFPILLLLLGIVGAAGEYRHRTAAPAALFGGRGRGQVLLARAAAYALTGAAVAAVALVASLGLGLPMLVDEPGPALETGDVALVAGGTLLAGALSGIIGVAVGALARNQVPAVIGALIIIFVVTPLLQTANGNLVDFTPYGAAMFVAGDTTAEVLSWGAALLVLTGWTVLLSAVAVIFERRRDVT